MTATTDEAPAPAAPPPAAPAARRDDHLPDRREALFALGGGLLGALVALAGAKALAPGAPEARDDEEPLGAREARERLVEGNERFVAGEPLHPDQSTTRREGLAEGQHPFCAVLSCADSRVPPEVLFDQGLGDLFVVRSAGQVLDSAVLGSLQYGVEHLEVPLLVVLGHTECGAVAATVESRRPDAEPTGTDIDALVAGILPAVEEAERFGAHETELAEVAVDVNVELVVERLKASPVIAKASTLREVKVVGAVYDLETGEVEFL
ncbi:carbonic anhydrase [Vallicoccus soli]|uniref:carbonic anhydrase n=1 Tax=Vallicoccus soli TaxID=2339232 RepID=A0A3A3ZMW5_9ACTN|nr:carbonic anhydrase [Vallicoccus soli]RJK98095.1 carbonic anhydrase [Vallicoccus soli]